MFGPANVPGGSLNTKQEKLTGIKGQVVGFNENGDAVPQDAPDTGVTAFNGRAGAVIPQAGDYTAEQVGAVPAGRTVNGKPLDTNITLTAADVGAVGTGGTAAAAEKLATTRALQVNLSSSIAASFDGSTDVNPGVTGTLPIKNGGTGSATAAAALYKLVNDSAALDSGGIADEDLIPIGDASASSGKKITLANFVAFILDKDPTASMALEKAISNEAAIAQANKTASTALETANAAKQEADEAKAAAQNAQKTADAAAQAVTKFTSAIYAIPSQKGSLTYTGYAQSPIWNSYDSGKMTISGATSGTNAGTYSVTFIPKDGYEWSDGTKTAKAVTWTIGKANIAVPSQSGSITYTGSAQSPSWSGYDTSKLTLDGTTSGTNAGSYNASFTPKSNYRWSDGMTSAKTVTWSISKAEGSLLLSKSSLSLNESSITGTVTVTRAGNGTISASSNKTSVATVSVSGTTLTITGKASGSATITVNVAAGTNHTAPSSKTISVSMTVTSASASATSGVSYTSGISSLSPAKLATYAKAISNNSTITKTTSTVYINDGNFHYKISIGDVISVAFSSTNYNMVVMGFNHYDLTTSTAYGKATATSKAGILFQMQDCLKTTYQMNSSDTNSGGWGNTALRSTLQGTIKDGLSSAWQSAIKKVRRTVSAGNQSTTINNIDDDLFLPTEVEVFGKTTLSVVGEGDQYAYYKAGNSKHKTANGYACSWWECSPRAESAGFCYVTNSAASGHKATMTAGVAPSFCV